MIIFIKSVTLFSFILSVGLLNAQEICNNGVDDDGDGLIDLNDVLDCVCTPVAIPSMIPNPSFEDMNCCPTTFSQLNCATDWQQATGPTSDYFNCGFSFGAATSAGLFPPPDGTGYVGAIFSFGWQEYVGSCLSSSMLAGQSYTLEFNIASTPIDGYGRVCNGGVIYYGAIDITIYGLAACPTFPIATSGCPSGWVVIGSVSYTPVNTWGVISIVITPPIDINAIIIGSPCSLPAGYGSNPCYPYFYFDNLILNETGFNIGITQTGTWCSNNIQFTADFVSVATYQWYLEGIALVGETGQNLNVSGNSYGAGNYSVVTTLPSGTCTVADYILTVPDFPTANFSANSECLNQTNTFTDNSAVASGSIVNWQWDFGDGNTSTLQNPTNNYLSPGNYSVSLTVTTDINCIATSMQTITIYPLPTAQYTLSNASGNGDGTYGFCLYDTVGFIDGSTILTGNIVSWQWDFGDGTTSSLQYPTHLYTSAGTYQITLLVTSDNGCLDSVTSPIVINPVPVSDFVFSSDCYYFDATFFDNSSISSGSIQSFGWSFGDGFSSSDPNPMHLYATSGGFDVSLIVVSDSGCVDTSSYTVERYPKPLASFILPDVCLNDSSCVLNNSLVIDNFPATIDTISSWIWNFGDGAPLENSSSPCHMYATDGAYLTTLIVETNHNCLDDTTISTIVHPLPVASFSNTTVCENVPPTQFTDNSSGSIVTWEWFFNLGAGTSNLQNPPFNFGSAGIYPVSEIVTTNAGCKDTVSRNIEVLAKPEALFSANQLAGCIDDFCPVFTDESISNATNVVTWEWDFGNSLQGSSNSEQVCYTNEGLYTVSLTVSNNNNCYDTIVLVDYIEGYPLPVADFDFSPQPTTIYEPIISFSNSSYDAYLWSWNFGDGSTDSVVYSPEHYYADSGFYQVILEVWTQYGCYDSVVKPVQIEPVVAIFVPNSFTPNGDGINDEFFIDGYGILSEGFRFYIFNRWGELIYSTDSFTPWDGSYGGTIVQEDTYIYKVELIDIFRKKHNLTGHVNVIR